MTIKLLAFFAIMLLLVACSPQVKQEDVTVSVIADGISQEITLTAGSTVQQTITAAGINISKMKFFMVL